MEYRLHQRPATGVPSRDSLEPGEYFRRLCEKFAQAKGRGDGAPDRCYRIGPQVFRFRFANSVLSPLMTPALGHLEVDSQSKADVQVLLWDSQSTGIDLEAPPWVHAGGCAVDFNDAGYFVQFNFGSQVLSAWDVANKTGVFWVADRFRVPSHETGSPLRAMLHWWTEDSPLQLLHGGAVGSKEGAVLLVGKGGSGKSSSCASVLRSDLFYLADDYCLVDTGPRPKVYSLYASAKLLPDMLGEFPHLHRGYFNAARLPEEKPVLLLYPEFAERICAELPLRAILIPRITGRAETTISQASPMAALMALAPSTIFQSSRTGRTAFRRTGELVRRLPCFFLELGADLSLIPAAIQRLLNEGCR